MFKKKKKALEDSAPYPNAEVELFIIPFTQIRMIMFMAFSFLLDSSSGCLKASTHQGALDVYVSQLGKVELKSHEGLPREMFYFDLV